MLRKKLIRNYKDIQNPNVRYKYGRFASLYGIFTNLILFIGKLAIGFFSGSVAILSDAIINLSDGISSGITLAGFKLSKKPADDEHPFGHARYEYISAFIISFIICILGVFLAKTSFENILKPEKITVTWIVIVVLVISIIIKFSQFLIFKKFGKRLDSDSIKANAIDARDDTIATIATLVAMLIILIFNLNIDAYMGLAVSVLVIISGFKSLIETIDPLIGEKPNQNLVKKIKKKILSYEGVLGCHELIIHSYGKTKNFVSIHIEVSADVDPLVTHDLIDDIEEDFLTNLGMHIVIQSDPIQNNNKLVNDLKSKIQSLLTELNEKLQVNDFRVLKSNNYTNIMFDCSVPYEVQLTKQQIIKYLKEKLNDDQTKYIFSIDIDRNYV